MDSILNQSSTFSDRITAFMVPSLAFGTLVALRPTFVEISTPYIGVPQMKSINFIGGEKGGVGKSVVSRVLAQYFIDRDVPFTGYDTDRSHASFRRFYTDYASRIIVDTYEGLDLIVSSFEDDNDPTSHQKVIVDLAAQTSQPLSRWINDSDLLGLFSEMDVRVYFWHITDGGKDSVDLLGRLTEMYGDSANFIIVRNMGRGSDFSLLDHSSELKCAIDLGARVITVPQLHETSMRKIDAQNASFWAAINHREGANSLGLLERQRVKAWLKTTYAALDMIPM